MVFIMELQICLWCVGGWGWIMEQKICWSFHGKLYVYACMPVHSLISCMALNLYGLFASVFEFYLWLGKEKKKRPQGLQLPVLIGKLIMSLWVGYLRVCVCLWKIQDLSLEAACDRGSSVLLTPPSPCSDRTTGERTEVLPSPAEGRYAARNPSRTIALSPVQIKHLSMCVVMRSCVFVWDLSVSGLLPTVADLAEFFTAVDICPSQHVLL